jgi:hypothetical protein
MPLYFTRSSLAHAYRQRGTPTIRHPTRRPRRTPTREDAGGGLDSQPPAWSGYGGFLILLFLFPSCAPLPAPRPSRRHHRGSRPPPPAPVAHFSPSLLTPAVGVPPSSRSCRERQHPLPYSNRPHPGARLEKGRRSRTKPCFCGSASPKLLQWAKKPGLLRRSWSHFWRLAGLQQEPVEEPELEPSQRGP